MISWIKYIGYGIGIVAVMSVSHVQGQYGRSIQWLSFEQLADSMRQHPKKVMIVVHTDWCMYCRLLSNKTFTDGSLIQLISANYYAVKLNAEVTESLWFAGKEYNFKPSGNGTGQHSLATMLATQNGQVIYPTLVLVDEKYQLLNRHVGFIKPQPLLIWLQTSELHSK